MTLRITPETMTCNGVDLATAGCADLITAALGDTWRNVPLYLGSDWLTNDRSAVRSAGLVAMPAQGAPRPVLDSAAYSALIRAITESAAWIEAQARLNPVPSLPSSTVTSEYERRIRAVLGSAELQASVGREKLELLDIVAAGGTLTESQQSDREMITAINTWETAMIDRRNAIMDSGHFAEAFDDAKWPAPPAGLVEFLKGY